MIFLHIRLFYLSPVIISLHPYTFLIYTTMKVRTHITYDLPKSDEYLVLIADSGSTRTDWGLADRGTYIKRITTQGMNPYFQTAAEIDDVIRGELMPQIGKVDIRAVHFYGAGCGAEDKKSFTQRRLKASLGPRVSVESDMMGTARALLGDDSGIACILGTGSNSCLYDGEKIVDQVPSLGFIIGDEGSGASLGKALVGNHFKRKLSANLSRKLTSICGLTLPALLEHAYKNPFPNRYLARFALFLKDNMDEEEVRELIYENFRSFFERNILQYADFNKHPICFTGSIAFHFGALLHAAAQSFSLSIRDIQQNPMEGLVRYHAKPK
jgi:N-acetylglucosamine kinase-like BadF-type ATPase